MHNYNHAAIFIWIISTKYKNFFVESISETNYKKIINVRNQVYRKYDIFYNKSSIPYDSVNDYFLLSQNNEKCYLGKIKADTDNEVRILKSIYSKNDLLKKSKQIKIIVYNDEEYTMRQVYLTTLSTASIRWRAESLTKDDGYILSKMTINYVSGKTQRINLYNMMCHVRGQSSSISEKNPLN